MGAVAANLRGARAIRARYIDAVMKVDTDIAVVGGGLVGLVSALALSKGGAGVTLIDRSELAGRSDPRASYLARSSERLLRRLGVSATGEPVGAILVAEGEPGRPVRSGSLQFEPEGDALGSVIENDVLREGLLDTLAKSDVVVREEVSVTGFDTAPGHVTLETDTGPVTSRLLVAADGRASPLRAMAGVGVERHDYGQRALTLTLAHSEPHGGAAYQIFFPGGPLALLPLPGNRSSVVWTDTPAAIGAAKSLPADALAAELRHRIGGTLGDVSVLDAPVDYPLEQRLATDVTADRLALVGDAAHVIHPLAGQGINLGLRDAAALADVVGEAMGLGRDIGGPALAGYARWRRGDIGGMATATDAVLHAYRLPGALGAARRLATSLIDASPLGAWLSREAAGERPNLPSLMA